MADPLVLSLDEIRAADAAIAGGKGANLGELIAAGFPVPNGFIVTTAAYGVAARSARVDPSDPRSAVDRLRAGEVPRAVATAALDAYRSLGGGKVAVRSSATAEDLPGASFAGQQDTFLNVEGDQSLIDAIRRCWASLWNERAVAYRRERGLDDQSVALAVVVQLMVDAVAAGVMFTADPINGRRGTAVIDAAPGLGDAVVSGAVDPDHHVVDVSAGQITERVVRHERPVMTDALIVELAEVGRRIERRLGGPQDVEFAVDGDERLWIVQARPITTLYPLPDEVPSDTRVYFSISVAQGYFAPITPMGMEVFLAIGRRVGATFIDDRSSSAIARSPVVVAGERPFVDVTAVLRDPVGRDFLERVSAIGEARSSVVFRKLSTDLRFAARHGRRVDSVRRILPVVLRSRIPLRALRLWLSPDRSRARLIRDIEQGTRVDISARVTASERLDAVEEFMQVTLPFVFPRLLPVVVAGMVSYVAAGRLLGHRAAPEELMTLSRGLPNNPTTEMDLALWELTKHIRSDAASRELLTGRTPAELAEAYRTGQLAPVVQTGLSAFLDRYGFRSVGEIDLGVARWSEDPTHLLGVISNYLLLGDDALAPDAQFRRGAREAEAMATALLGRVRGPRRLLLRFLLGRARALMGSRELPKYMLIRNVFTPIRAMLRPVGAELAATGRVSVPEDIYFLTLAEARGAIAGADVRETVAVHRAVYAREIARRHVPRVLLSDGTDAEVALVEPVEGGLRGSPASPGVVTGKARVIRSPQGAHLEPGEILVTPSTDPGWTPLFLTAGGLVMEMGGMMSHGAVVAREYGIPAVVGVAGATERIVTGDSITVDGTAGVVSMAAT
ncbi:MAG: phosphoenolpyruvate synthase [Chloroflexi bacterium]|nr:MAG: phosphoenolpyruvate synthase [Chloroflexota bacterium]